MTDSEFLRKVSIDAKSTIDDVRLNLIADKLKELKSDRTLLRKIQKLINKKIGDSEFYAT